MPLMAYEQPLLTIVPAIEHVKTLGRGQPNQSLRASQDGSGPDTGTSTGPGDQAHGGEYGDRTSQGGGSAWVAESYAEARPNQRLKAQGSR
jgi:hypothetical protein